MIQPTPLAPGQRLILAGMTGSGKSVALARAIVDQPLRGVIIDTKDEDEFKKLPHAVYVDGLEGVDLDSFALPSGPDFIIVRPTPAETADPDVLDDFLLDIYENAGNLVVGIDELYTVALGSYPRPGITAIYTRGRSRRISMIAGTQRPTLFPLFCLTEANEFYEFYLARPEDRERIAGVTVPALAERPVDRHTFWWYKMGETEAQLAGPVTPLPVPRNTVQANKRYERVRLL